MQNVAHLEGKFTASNVQTAFVSKKLLWAGRIISTLVIAFLLLDGIVKVLMLAPAVEGSVQLGYPESTVFGIGLLLLACTVIYAIPRTAVLGAILLTGYLGGAVATHVRVGADVFPILFAVIFGVLVWLGIYLRDERLRALVPLRN